MSACKNELTPTKTLNSDNNPYVKMLLEDFSHCALDEERAPQFKGKWSDFYSEQKFNHVDLEIGTGNGLHFAHRAALEPKRLLLGIEIKFKPLIQSIRRAHKNSPTKNSVMMRYNAYRLEDLFVEGEINDVFIHHPDPWPKKKQVKHRLLQPEYLEKLYKMQKPGSILDFKTDSVDYFEWATPILEASPYKIIKYTKDLHNSEYAKDNFETHFEKIFLRKGQPIFYAQMIKE
jgi:tRNA (guanine-N7-)-methyltransferase